jgi:hypothetical protein
VRVFQQPAKVTSSILNYSWHVAMPGFWGSAGMSLAFPRGARECQSCWTESWRNPQRNSTMAMKKATAWVASVKNL